MALQNHLPQQQQQQLGPLLDLTAITAGIKDNQFSFLLGTFFSSAFSPGSLHGRRRRGRQRRHRARDNGATEGRDGPGGAGKVAVQSKDEDMVQVV